jgi:hypothetical protein
MAKWTFGEAFADSYNQGIQTKQKADQFAEQVRLDEEKMKAEESFRGMQMEQWTKDLAFKEKNLAAENTNAYNSLYAKERENYNATYIPITDSSEIQKLRQMGFGTLSSEETKKMFGNYGPSIPNAPHAPKEIYLLMKAQMLEEAKQAKANAPIVAEEDLWKGLNKVPMIKEDFRLVHTRIEQAPKISTLPQDVSIGLDYAPVGMGQPGESQKLPPKIDWNLEKDINPESAAERLNALASLYQEASNKITAYPQLNQSPVVTAIRQSLWQTLKGVQGKNIPYSPVTKSVIDVLNNEYGSLETQYNAKIRNELTTVEKAKEFEGQSERIEQLRAMLTLNEFGQPIPGSQGRQAFDQEFMIQPISIWQNKRSYQQRPTQ